MKKLLLFSLMLFIAASVSAQKLKVNEVDKFTKEEKLQTSTETLYTSAFMGGLANIQYQFTFAIRRINGKYAMPANIIIKECFKFDEDSSITFLLADGTTVTLKTLYTGISKPASQYGWEFDTAFEMSDEDITKLKSQKCTDIRISYLGGSYDRKLKPNKQEMILKCLKLFEGK